MKTTEHTESTEGKKDPLTAKVIGCAIEVHRCLGPGLLESAYQQCLAHEMKHAGLKFSTQTRVPVYYKGINLDCGYRADFIVDYGLILELKAVERISPLHQAQLLTYMKLAEAPTGLIINFNSKLLKDGVQRFVL